MDEQELNQPDPLQVEHEDIMDGLGEVASTESPSPVAEVQEIPTADLMQGASEAASMDELGEIAAREKPPQQQVHANAAVRAAQRRERLDLPPRKEAAQQAHRQEFEALGKVVREEMPEPDSGSRPIEVPVDEMNRLSFPDNDDPNAVGASLQSFMEGNKECWKQLVMTLTAHGDALRYVARELESIREAFERSRG